MSDKTIQSESFQFSAAEQMAINEALTDKTDIVWRLRANWSYLGREAADEIARLRNQVEQLRSEVADAKKWAMQERSLRWAATTNSDEISRTVVDGDCALHNRESDEVK